MVVPLIAIALHMFNPSLIPEFEAYILNITKAGYAFDLYIAVQKGSDYSSVTHAWPEAIIIEHENRGFDIGSFLASLVQILDKPYTYILKLHSKNHPGWRKELIAPLLSTPARVDYALNKFKDPTIGMIGCRRWTINIGHDFGHNRIHIAEVSRKWRVPVQPCRFVGGTIFWIRASILREAVRPIDLLEISQSLNTIETLDWSWYLMTYPELRGQGVQDQKSAEAHWKSIGRSQGRACNCLHARVNQIGTPNCDGMHEHAYERFFGMLVANAHQHVIGVGENSLLGEHHVQVLALYHPQVDWKLVRGLQPHSTLGYYTSDSKVLGVQVAMMRDHGIQGICYQLTNETLDFIDHLNTDLPFCLSWETGTIVNLAKMASLFNHPRYIRIKDRPALFLPDEVRPPAGFELVRASVNLPPPGDQLHTFSKELHQAFTQKLARNTHDQYIVLNSWNDWVNQVAVEPSQRFGYKYLQEFRNILKYFD
jgi:hypothetical protein